MFHVKHPQTEDATKNSFFGISEVQQVAVAQANANTIASVATKCLHFGMTEHEDVGLWRSHSPNKHPLVGFTTTFIYIDDMRRALIILTLAIMNANAVDCIRATFDYFATQYMPEDDMKFYILPGSLKPDSLYQKQKSQIFAIKFHWTGDHLDDLVFSHSCLDDGATGTVVPDWKVDSAKVGKLKKYTWTFSPKYADMDFTVYRGKDSIDIVRNEDPNRHYTFYIKNDTIHELDNWIPRHWIIYRDPKDENKCYRANGKEKKFENGSVLKVGEEVYTTYEYETRGDFLIQKIFEPDRNRYVKPPGPCEGGDKYTTIYYRKKK